LRNTRKDLVIPDAAKLATPPKPRQKSLQQSTLGKSCPSPTKPKATKHFAPGPVFERTPEKLLNDLCAAAWREDLHGFQQIISDVPPAGLAGVFSGKNTKGFSLLYCAVFKGCAEIVLEILNYKAGRAHVNFQSPPSLDTALHVAAFFEKSEVIALLLFSGANYNLRNSLGKTPTEVSQGASAEIFAQFLPTRVSLTKQFPRVSELVPSADLRESAV